MRLLPTLVCFRRHTSSFLKKGSNISVISVPYNGGQGKLGVEKAPTIMSNTLFTICSSLGYSFTHKIISWPQTTASQSGKNTQDTVGKVPLKNVEATGKVCEI